MKKTATLLASLFVAATAFAQVKDYREIKAPPLRSFSMPQPKRIQLGNGMVIFLQEDKELPLVRGRATIRGGVRDVPAEKAGMAGIYGQAWRTGGTTKQSGDELDQFLEARAAFVETGADTDSTNVSLNVLKQDLDAVFPIWLDLLRNPAFRQEKIDLAKTQANTGISRRNDEPGGILSRESTRLGYGPTSPYARQSEYATIASITRQDLLDFHKRTVHPNNIIISFIGDFDSAAMERRLRQAFESWPRGPQVAKPDPAITAAKPGVYFVSKDDVTQANIAMVHAGTERNNPDYPALQVMNEVFSGGFSGRLMQALRSQRGLTYGVGGSVGAPWDYPGLFRVQMATKSETTLEAIDALRGEVRRLVSDPITDTELSLAKESILNAYVFTMDTKEKALQQRVLLEFYGFPPDYFTKYPALIEKVTAADVQRVARKYVQPDNLSILVVGNQAKFEKPLSTLGTVTPIDITIPPAQTSSSGGSASAAPRPAGSNAEGMALIRKVQEFVGGPAALNGINAVRVTSARNIVTPQGPMSMDTVTLVRYPDALRQENTMAMGKMTSVLSPDAAFVITPMGTQDLPSSQRDEALGELKAEVLNILRNVNNPKYTFHATGGDLTINADGAAVRWVVDPATGRILRTIRSSSRGETTTEYTEWKQFGPVQMATAAKMTRGGEPAGDMKVSNVEINPTIEANAFVKP
ncbi:MAG TPA: pitrilysin family protein [Thermoanaerobaculia bacterium]